MSEKIFLSIIIVNFKADDFLQNCVRSIGQNPLWEVIVIDNSQNNRGYGAGCNLGATKAVGKYYLFLNPDVLVLPGSLKKMIAYMAAHPEISTLAPRLYTSQKKEKQLSFCRFPDPLTAVFVFSPIKSFWPDNPLFSRYVYKDNLEETPTRSVEAVSGAAILIRKEVFEKVGGFDCNFFLYFEENDLCRRIKKQGGKIVFFPEAKMIHFGGGSLQDKEKISHYFRQSRYRFFRKHYPFLFALLTEGIVRLLEKLTFS